MMTECILGAGVAAFIAAYLLYALARPEKF